MTNQKFSVDSVDNGFNSERPRASTYLDFIQKRKAQGNVLTPSSLFTAADEKMVRIQDIVIQTADNDFPVLVTGEQGSGKEIVARSIHRASSRSECVVINCQDKTTEELEIELFGVEGSPEHRRAGKFSRSGQTIILDEITALDNHLQLRLVRMLQDQSFEPVGGGLAIPYDAKKTKLVALTTKDLSIAISQGKFRKDLYYRLYVLHIEIPPLRERPKDIVALAEKFLLECRDSFARPGLVFTGAAMEKLRQHSWPGNIRELQNVIQRAVVLSGQDEMTPDMIPVEGEGAPIIALDWVGSLPVGQTLHTVETHFILETLKKHKGNRTHAAKTLGISLRTLRNKINEFNRDGYDVTPPTSGRGGK